MSDNIEERIRYMSVLSQRMTEDEIDARFEELEAQLRVLLILGAYAEMEGDNGQDS